MNDFDPLIFKERARRFEELDVSRFDLDELYRELMFVVSTSSKDPTNLFETRLLVNVRTCPVGTVLWRARSIPADDHYLPLRTIQSDSDVWEPPAHVVFSPGRLNRVNESLLYTCLGVPMAAAHEIRLRAGERFALAKFVTTQPTKLVSIGLPFPTNGPPIDNADSLINEFMGRQFTRITNDRTDDVYHISNLVAKFNYNLPLEVQDGWLYFSAQCAGALNATFKLEPAHSKLELQGIAICSLDCEPEQIRAVCYAASSRGSRGLEWHLQHSDVQKELFSEFD